MELNKLIKFLLIASLITLVNSLNEKWRENCRPTASHRPPAIIDASVRFPDGTLYVFSGSFVSRISRSRGQHSELFADNGWPKLIDEVWPGLASDLTSAFALQQQVFFLKVSRCPL